MSDSNSNISYLVLVDLFVVLFFRARLYALHVVAAWGISAAVITPVRVRSRSGAGCRCRDAMTVTDVLVYNVQGLGKLLLVLRPACEGLMVH